jgi:hypothetical protein
MPSIEEFLEDAKRRMDKSIEMTRTEFNSVRTGRASAALSRSHLDRLLRDPDAAQEHGDDRRPEPRMLTVQPFDPTQIKAIEKAMMESDLGLTPSNDGKIDPPPDPAADRGAPQGARQARPPLRRGRQGCDPKRPPRRAEAPRGARQERRRRRRRGAARRRPRCRSSPTSTSARSTS